ncbi:MAG: STAS domain-containing protein [Solirubrobacteraceae bacterium]
MPEPTWAGPAGAGHPLLTVTGERLEWGSTLLVVTGELDIASAPALELELGRIAHPGDRVTLDMFEVSFVDLIGLRVILGADRRLRATGGAVKIARPARQARRLAELWGVGRRLLAIDPPIR